MCEHDGWRFKQYDIHCHGDAMDDGAYESAVQALLTQLPTPAMTADRPGVGFIIRHQGPEWQYAVLFWWDNQNELVQRILVRDRSEAAGTWHPPSSTQSICVHDLAVIWSERNAYIEHVLGPEGGPDLAAYLDARFEFGIGG
jgi:hypothetical protein